MRHRALALLALIACAALAQKPDWPQPIVKGTVLVWGGEQAKDAARTSFLALARTDGRILVLAEDPEAARPLWKDSLRARVVGVPTREDFEGATSVWLERMPEAPLAKAVVKIKQEGGTVAISNELFAHGSFHDLLPYVGAAFAGTDSTNVSAIVCQISEDSVLVAQGRDLSTRGEGGVKFLISGGKGTPTDEIALTGRERADLVSLRRRVIERSLPEFPPKEPKTPVVKSGTLFIVGGGGMPDGLLERFIEACGGPEAPIVYVPCEFSEELAGVPGFVRTLERAGAKNVTWIHTKDRNKADHDEEFLKPLKGAKGVWFGGGRQWNLVDSYMDTQAHELMKRVLERGGAIGGSSAGASIQAEFLARGDPLGNLNIIAPGYTRGLGFLGGVAVDQHFTQRQRHKDMTSLMEAYPQLLGIGIDEATAIVVAGSVAEVTGRGQVFFYDYSKGKPKGDTDYTALKSGDKYDLAKRQKTG
jgi:cyanophycinase